MQKLVLAAAVALISGAGFAYAAPIPSAGDSVLRGEDTMIVDVATKKKKKMKMKHGQMMHEPMGTTGRSMGRTRPHEKMPGARTPSGAQGGGSQY
jgi:hypothetical protein